MANLRILKKEIDYRLEEFVFDCEMAIYFQPSTSVTSLIRFINNMAARTIPTPIATPFKIFPQRPEDFFLNLKVYLLKKPSEIKLTSTIAIQSTPKMLYAYYNFKISFCKDVIYVILI